MNDTLKSIFRTLSENAEENFIKNKNAEDYLAEDGLWHCGKCGTAKQFRLPEQFTKMGMPEIVGCCCACQSAKEKREKAEYQLASVIRQNKKIANIPEHYRSADIADVESSDAKKIGLNYIKLRENGQNRTASLRRCGNRQNLSGSLHCKRLVRSGSKRQMADLHADRGTQLFL